MIVLIIYIINLLLIVKGQVIDEVRQQPVLLKYSSKCCNEEYFENPNAMIDCIQQSTSLSNDRLYTAFNNTSLTKPMIVIVTYYTLNIIEGYASKSIASLAAYAEQNDYIFYPFNGPNTKHDYAPYDPRWNKIQILLNMLNEAGSNSSYVVWVDADLIVLDFGMKIEMIGSLYSHASIIISKDMESATYISNSGFIIVKNSDWSKTFLEQWWSSYDKRKCCDQNVLTWLYDKMSPEEKENIVILRSDALNTEFPCWKNLKNYNQVLHLAGATSLYRNQIFDTSFREVCNALDRDPPHLNHQLSVNREYLEEQMLRLLELRLDTSRVIMNKIEQLSLDLNDSFNDKCASHNIVVVFKDVLILKNHLNDVLKFDDYEDVSNIDKLITNEVYIREKMFDLLYHLISHHSECSFSGNDCSIPFLEMMRETISMGFELTIAKAKTAFDLDKEESLRKILLKIKTDLLNYFDNCSLTQLTHRVLYYKFKNCQLLAESFTRTYLLSSAMNNGTVSYIIHYYEEALDYWERMIHENYYGADYVLADPYKEGIEVSKELGTYQCLIKEYDKGLEHLYIALRLQEKTIEGYESIKIASVPDVMNLNVAMNETITNINICENERDQSSHKKQRKVLMKKKKNV